MKSTSALLAALSVPAPLLFPYLLSGSDRRWQPEVVTETTERLVLGSDGFHRVELTHDVILDPWWYTALDLYAVLIVIAVVAFSVSKGVQ